MRELSCLDSLKTNMVGRQADPRRIVEAVFLEKVAGRLVQVFSRQKGIARPMADDEYFPATRRQRSKNSKTPGNKRASRIPGP